jgi:hypothetical protein
MAGKFVDLKEAAKMIGVTAEELVEMRSRGDIFGYRDGASWKFKMEEVERVLAERAGSNIGSGAGSAIFAANDEEFDNLISGLSSKIVSDRDREDPESILVTEQELGHSAEGTSSTIIGKQGKKSAADSDLHLATDGGSGKGSDKGSGSDKLLEAPGARLKGGEGSDVLGGTHLKTSGGSGTGDMPGAKSGSGTGDMPGIKSGSGTGDMPKVKSAGGSEVHLGDEMKMADDDLELGSDDALDEEIGLAGSHKGKGSDVTLGSGDSGINLKPSDSGLNLDEEPLDLGGSAVESLELPEDDDVIALEEEPADPEEATQLKADDQFMLSASDALMEDESDSGSQVIALEDSEAFDENAATMLKAGEQPLLADDAFAAANMGPADPLAAATLSPGMAPAGAPMYVQQVELPYSIWNVLSLFAITIVLTLTGMFMTDVMLNMWSWNGGGGSASTGLMDTVISTFGLKG